METDPKVFGPGMWYLMHRKARLATNQRAKLEFIDFLNFLVDNLPCAKCKNHAKTYLQLHPIIQYMNMKDRSGNEIGMFYYTWEFHNNVNERLNQENKGPQKPIIDFETAYIMYGDDEIGKCTKGCDDTSNKS